MLSQIDWTFLAIAAPFFAAIVAPFVNRLAGEYAAWILAVVPALLVLHFSRFLPDIADNIAYANGFGWVWQINVRFSYLIDGLSLMFALLISVVGTVIVIHAGTSLKGDPRRGRFFCLLFLLMGSSLGLVLADDFLMLFIFWEMTAIAGFLLVSFHYDDKTARQAAWPVLLIPVAGGLPLLAGLLMLIGFLGVPSMSDALALRNTFTEHPAYLSVLVLILSGAFAKSAQFPFQFWLPKTTVAPLPAAAYLQSSTLAPAGVYLLMRIHPFLGDTPAWSIILPTVGGLTLLTGAVLALRQSHLPGLLAQTTVAMLGLIVMLLGTSLPGAVLAACATLLAHALAIGALLLAAGTMTEETGTDDINGLRGLIRVMPVASTALFLAGMTLAGAPITLRYWAMRLAHDALLIDNILARVLLAVLVLATALIVAAAFTVAFLPLFKSAKGPLNAVGHKASGVGLGAIGLSLGAVLAAIFGAWTAKYLLNPAYLAITLRLGDAGAQSAIRIDTGIAIIAAIWALGAALCWARWGRQIRAPGWQQRAETAIGLAGGLLLAGVGTWAVLRLPVALPPATTLDASRFLTEILQGLAIATVIAAPLFALRYTGWSALRGCLVVSGVATVSVGLALGTPIGLAGAVAFAIQFVVVLAGLEMTVAAARRTGRLAWPRDAGMDRFAGVLAATTLVFALAVAGLPPFSGFWPRVLLIQAALLEARWAAAAALLLGGLLILIAAARVAATALFAGQPADYSAGMPSTVGDDQTVRNRLLILAPPVVLAALTVFLGIWPAIVMSVVDRSVAALLSP